jgi:Bacterial inner membrane protein
MSTFLLSQLLVALAFAAGLAAFQFRARPAILRSWSLCAALNGAHFLLLGVPGAATLAAMISVRFLVASFTRDRRVMVFFMILSATGFLATYTRPVGLLALAATLLGTWASFQPNDRTVRATLAICASLWVLHNAIVGSPVATVMELAFLASNAIGWRRFHGRAKMDASPVASVRTDDGPRPAGGD